MGGPAAPGTRVPIALPARPRLGSLATGPAGAVLLLGVALAIAALPGAAGAQVVQGRVVEGVGGPPVEGALVALLDAADRSVATTLTNTAGLFRLHAPGPGRYLVRSERIGFRSTRSEPVEVGIDTVFVSIVVDVEPVPLAGIEVEASNRCRLRDEAGAATARVWDEARKALEAARWTEEMGEYRYRLVEVVQRLNRRGSPLTDPDSTISDRFRRSPFTALPAEELVSGGFARTDGEEVVYYGPDAAVLLSDAFLDAHCLRLRGGEDEAEGLVGLAFEPLGDETVGIRGTLWLDPGSSRLRWLDYAYEGLRRVGARGDGGGRVVFESLPNGAWIVREWRIRMPLMSTLQTGRVVGYGVKEARVLAVRDDRGRPVLDVESAVVSAVVVDSTGAGPAPEAEVLLMETGDVAAADAEGIVRFGGLSDGRYHLMATTPRLRAFGWEGEAVAVEAVRGTIATARLALPSALSVALGRCGDRPGAVLVGTVTDDGGKVTVAGARVRLTWEDGEASALSDPGGRYLLCDVPPGVRGVLHVEDDPGRLPVRVPDEGGPRVIVRDLRLGGGAGRRVPGAAGVSGRRRRIRC